jgi:hypothetical protein
MITRLSESTASVFQRRAYWTGSIVIGLALLSVAVEVVIAANCGRPYAQWRR